MPPPRLHRGEIPPWLLPQKELSCAKHMPEDTPSARVPACGPGRGLSDCPLHSFGPAYGRVSHLKLAGRGGSVSRRVHNPAAGNRTLSQAEPTPQKHTRQTPAALRERGSGGEGLLSEKPPLPQNLRVSPVTLTLRPLRRFRLRRRRLGGRISRGGGGGGAAECRCGERRCPCRE